MSNYILRHLQVLFHSFGQLARTPYSSSLSIAVLGIALALPSGLYVLVTNAKSASVQWQGRPQISVFLELDTTETRARALAAQVERRPGVSRVTVVPAAAALEEFKTLSGFGEALDALGSNPLPAVLIVQPVQTATPEELKTLVGELSNASEVDLAQLDLEWVQRLHAIIKLAQRGVILLAALLGLAVIVIISNSIRLAIFNRRDEIEIISLIGGTEAFVQRPFLYAGLVQGALGGVFAWLLISFGLGLMAGPVAELAKLYGSNFALTGLGHRAAVVLIGIASVLGWVASWITVTRYLNRLYWTK